MPQRLRMDNGAPWGGGHDLPPPLVLWCVGLGITPIWNHPYSPTENPNVERQNGTLNRWGEPARCSDYAAWEAKLEWVARTQRAVYPAVGGQSRLAAHPELLTNPRRYAGEEETEQWQLERVTAYLAGWAWPRQVSQRGQISVYGKAYEVGRAHGGQPVWLRFEAASREWVIQDAEGQELARHRAEQITSEKICHLQVSKPHASGHKRPGPPSKTRTVTLRNAA